MAAKKALEAQQEQEKNALSAGNPTFGENSGLTFARYRFSTYCRFTSVVMVTLTTSNSRKI